MVLHAGIVCYKKNGSMMTYNSVTRQKEVYNLIAVGPHDMNGVDLMFENLKTQLNGEFGCACICLGYTYDSEIRKKFIEAAEEFGFVNVHITNWCSMNYYDLVSRLTNYRIMVGHVIWIFCGKYCYVWEKERSYAEFVDEFEYNDTVGSLKWIRRESETNPDYIIYGDIYETKWKTVEKIFKDSVVFRYTSLNSVNGVLTGALIMANYTHLHCYKTEPMLERDIKLKINNSIIFSIHKWQSLPWAGKKFIMKPYGCNTCEIMSHSNKTHQKLPDFEVFFVTLDIDENGNCSVTFDEVQHNSAAPATADVEYITAGVMPSRGEIIYGSSIENAALIKNENMAEEFHDVDKIESVLIELKDKINLSANQRFKNVYVFLDKNYNNEIRKEVIISAIKLGFENVKFVDQESMNFVCGLTNCKNLDNFDECIIWIFNGLQCHLWKKVDFRASYMGVIPTEYLRIMKENPEQDEDPNFVFHFDDEEINESVLQGFPDCETVNLKGKFTWKSFAFDWEKCIFDIDAVLDREIIAKIEDHEILLVQPYQKLPLSIIKEIENDTKSEELTITECKNIVIKIPRVESFYLQIDIDKNGIYSIDVVNDDVRNETETEMEKQPYIVLSDDDNPVTINEDVNAVLNIKMNQVSNSDEEKLSPSLSDPITIIHDSDTMEEKISLYEEAEIPESKEKLKAFREPMVMADLFATPETPKALENLITSSSQSLPLKFKHQEIDEVLSPPINELSLLPPPSYEESQSYFRQPSPVPSQQLSQVSLHEDDEEDDDDDNDADTISQLRLKLAEQKRLLIDRLEPKILKWAPSEDVKKVSDMMAHKDISELLEYLENEDFLKAKITVALNFLHDTTNVVQRPRSQIKSRQQATSSRTAASNNSQTRPRWR
jgi:hypothetical protein